MHVANDGFVPAAYRRWFEYGLRLTLPLYSVRGSCVSDAELGKFITYFPQPYVSHTENGVFSVEVNARFKYAADQRAR